MRSLLVCLILINSFTVFAQNKGKVLGHVLSEGGAALEKATVSILNPQDSSVLSYTLTDAKGRFEFVRLPQQRELQIYISHIGASNYTKRFTIGESGELNFGEIVLGGRSLEEVVVTAVPPIRMNKDTLEYSADYFKTRPNANVEELLKELPGLQVNMDGTIYYEGKEVSQVKVNGKDFFSSDLRIATRNLDASLIKTIQVYRDRGESKKNVDDEENLPITINLKFKSDFLRTDFGKVYASGGTRDRYEAGALFNTFRDTLQLSFIAFGNNINRQSFDYNEFNQHAGLGRAENYGFENFGGQNYSGVGNDMATGINLNNDWGKNTKLNVMYMYRYNKLKSENESNSTALYDDTEQFNTYNRFAEERSSSHSLKSFFRHRFDTTAYLEFRPDISFSHRKENSENNSRAHTSIDSLTRSSTSNRSNNNGLSYSHRFYIEKQLSKNHVFSFSNTIDINKSEDKYIGDQNTVLYQASDLDTKLFEDRLQDNRTNNLYLSTAYYNKVWKKLNYDLFFTFNASRNTPHSTFYYNRNETELVHGTTFENNYIFKHQDYISGIKFSWKPLDKLVVNFGTAYQIKDTQFDFTSIDVRRDHSSGYILPNINVRYKEFNVGWSKDLRNPDLYGILQQRNDLNPTMISLPALEFGNIQTQETFISYNKYNQKIQFGSRLGMSYQDRSIGTRSWRNQETGQYTIQNYQSGSQQHLNGYLYVRYNFKSGKDWQFYVSSQPHVYSYQNYQTINNIENKSTNMHINLNNELSIRWKGKIGFAPKYTLAINKNTNSITDNSDFVDTDYLTHSIGAGLNINSIKGVSIETTYSLQNRANGLEGRRNYNILNSSVYYTLKNNAQIKLSGFDMLNENIQNYWGSNGNTTYYGNSLTLKQYFLLGYIHKFNSTKMK